MIICSHAYFLLMNKYVFVLFLFLFLFFIFFTHTRWHVAYRTHALAWSNADPWRKGEFRCKRTCVLCLMMNAYGCNHLAHRLIFDMFSPVVQWPHPCVRKIPQNLSSRTRVIDLNVQPMPVFVCTYNCSLAPTVTGGTPSPNPIVTLVRTISGPTWIEQQFQ